MTSKDESNSWFSLLPYQRNALQHIQGRAVRRSGIASEHIGSILERVGLSKDMYDEAMGSVRNHARVAIHFHPERHTRGRRSVAAGLLESGLYKSQFETGISSGSPTAFRGGERDRWEDLLFGGAYSLDEELAQDRPKYGALEVMCHPDGPAPRFGSSYFLLKPTVSRRCTFTFGGSHEENASDHTGTLDLLEPTMAPLLAQLENGAGAFNVTDLTVTSFLHQLTHGLSNPFLDPRTRGLGNCLDSFIEVQVHGEIRLDKDAERLVADPAFQNHHVGDLLNEISAKYEIPLSWHPGFTLPVSAVPAVFRDYPVRPLAERIAGRGILDPANIGAAANSLEIEPKAWENWASYDDTLTQFRRLWHILVLNGKPNTFSSLE